MYPKGGNLLHSIRHSINNDEKFRGIMRGLNKTFYHQTVTSQQVEKYISTQAGFDYDKVFDQYLRTTQIPVFELNFNEDKSKVSYRYTNCVKGFNLPLALTDGKTTVNIYPSENWKQTNLKKNELTLFALDSIESMYYIKPVLVDKQ
jgi:aminopeptidase N